MRLFNDDEETWAGGFYELAIERGPHPGARLEPMLTQAGARDQKNLDINGWCLE